MRKWLICFGLILLLASCGSESLDCCLNIVADVDIVFLDKNGDNRLHSHHPEFVGAESIELSYLVDGEVIMAMNQPRIFEKDANLVLRVYVNTLEDSDETVSYLNWNGDIDTIDCSIVKRENLRFVHSVWYNKKLVWDNEGEVRTFEVIKD